MRTVSLCFFASLLLAATLVSHAGQAADLPTNSHQRWDAKGAYSVGSDSASGTSCPIKLRPSGQCGSSGAGAEDEDCPYQLTLPPLTIQLPKQFRLLEKAMKELQSLKEVVNKLKSGCQDCRGAGSNGPSGYQQADQGRSQVLVQRDGDEASVQEVPSASSQEERGDGMATGAAADATGEGQSPTVGKITPVPGNLQEMQVRKLLAILIFKMYSSFKVLCTCSTHQLQRPVCISSPQKYDNMKQLRYPMSL